MFSSQIVFTASVFTQKIKEMSCLQLFNCPNCIRLHNTQEQEDTETRLLLRIFTTLENIASNQPSRAGPGPIQSRANFPISFHTLIKSLTKSATFSLMSGQLSASVRLWRLTIGVEYCMTLWESDETAWPLRQQQEIIQRNKGHMEEFRHKQAVP